MNERGAILDDIMISNARNIDWEDICHGEEGFLYISDMGNNGNKRTDFGLYVLPEPTDIYSDSVEASVFYKFRYPDRHQFPPERNNFDCEGIFWFQGDLYFLTKCRYLYEVVSYSER